MNKPQRRNALSLKTMQGFSLIELMTVLVIAAILATVAVPAYNSQVLNTRRDEGKTILIQAAAKQEIFYLDNGVYTDDMTDLGYAANPLLSPKEFYEISATITDADGQSFLLTATREGSQTNDTKCGDFTLSSFSVRSAINATEDNPGSNCW